MKKLNLFAIGVVAMLVAATGVAAQDYDKILTAADVETCLGQQGTATCKVLAASGNLSADVTVKGNINLVIDDDVTISTNGQKIVVDNGASLTINGGTIDAAATAVKILEVNAGGTLEVKATTLKSTKTSETTKNLKGLIIVYAATAEDGPQTKVTLGAGSKLDGQNGILVQPGANATGYSNADAAGYNVELNLNGDIKAQEYAAQVNGNIDPAKNIVVNVKAGTYESTQAIALYAAGVSTWTIEKGVTVSGLEAVVAKAGKLVINGGKFTATGQGSASGLNQRAGSAIGSAIAVINEAAYNEDGNGDGDKTVEVDILDGEFTSDHGYALYIADRNGYETIEPSVKGGKFVAKDTAKDAVIASDLKGARVYFIEGGSFTTKSSTDLDDYLVADLSFGKDAEGNAIVGTPYTVTLNVKLGDGVEVAYTVPEKELEAVKGQNINLLKLVGLDTKNPEDRAKRYAVKYTVSNGTTGLDEFTMVGEDVTIEAEIVVVNAKTQPSENIPTTPGTEPGTQEPGTDPGTTPGTEPGTTTPSDDEENPNTLDNVTSVAAMGGISLAIAAAGIATLKKREN